MEQEINKLRPLAVARSVEQMGQHSPKGVSGLRQSFMSSQIMSSQRTVPVSQTQIRQGSGFHTSLSLYLRPSCTQLPAFSAPRVEQGKQRAKGRRGGCGSQKRKRERGCSQLDIIQMLKNVDSGNPNIENLKIIFLRYHLFFHVLNKYLLCALHYAVYSPVKLLTQQ